MKNINYHDSLYAPFGGFLLNEDSFSAVQLKKRHSSVCLLYTSCTENWKHTEGWEFHCI